MTSWTRRARGWVAGLAAGLALGCSEEPPAAETALGDPTQAEAAGEDRPPVISRLRLEPAEPLSGDRIRAVATARDPDGDRVEISYRWSVADVPQAEDGAELQLEGVAKGDLVEVEVTASDGSWESETAYASAEIRNRRPVVVGVRLEPAPSVAPGEKLVAVAVGQDEDGDAVDYRYDWRVNGRSVDEDGPSLDTSAFDRGDEIQVYVTANDGESDSDAVESIVVQIGNANPEIVSDPTGFREDGRFVYQVEARDPDGDRNLRYSLRNAPEGMRVDPILGEVSWRPTPEQTGVHSVEVVVTDPQGAWTLQRFELNVAVAEAAAPAAPDPGQ